MGDIIGTVGTLASFIGSLTVVGGALIWMYNRFIGEPRERKRERDEVRRQNLMLEVITRENKPLNEAIQQLTTWLNESKEDRVNLNKIAERNSRKIRRHEDRIDDHNDRILILEVKNNIRKGGE